MRLLQLFVLLVACLLASGDLSQDLEYGAFGGYGWDQMCEWAYQPANTCSGAIINSLISTAISDAEENCVCTQDFDPSNAQSVKSFVAAALNDGETTKQAVLQAWSEAGQC